MNHNQRKTRKHKQVPLTPTTHAAFIDKVTMRLLACEVLPLGFSFIMHPASLTSRDIGQLSDFPFAGTGSRATGRREGPSVECIAVYKTRRLVLLMSPLLVSSFAWFCCSSSSSDVKACVNMKPSRRSVSEDMPPFFPCRATEAARYFWGRGKIGKRGVEG